MKFRFYPAALCILLFAACGKPPEAHPQLPPPDQPVSGGTLAIALQASGKSLDPHVVTDAASMRLIELMYATLMRYTDTYGEVEPWLAREVSWSDDNRTLTLNLHTNAVFHVTGRSVTSEDVAYSIRRIREKGARADQFEAIATIRTPDPHTVIFELDHPSAPLLTALASPMNAVVDREIVEKNDGSLATADAGSGPFELVEWKKGQYLELKAADDYFEAGLPRLNSLLLRPISDETARTTAFRNGEVDILVDLAAKDLALLQNRPGIEVQSVQGTFWEYVGMNTEAPLLNDLRVRQAIALTLNRASLLNLVKFGRGTVLDSGPVPPNHWAHLNPPVYTEPDIEEAKRLLAEAGLSDGTALTLKVGSSFPYQIDAAQIVKQHLQEIGLKVEIIALESGVFFDALNQGDFELTLVGWLGFVDPDEWLYNLFHSEGKWNQQSYANAEVDALLKKGKRTLSRSERMEIYHRAQEIIVREAPMAFLYVNDLIGAKHDHVQNYTPHPTGTLRGLAETWRWDGN